MLLKNLCSFSKGIQIKRDLTSIDYVIPYLHYGDLYKKYNVEINFSGHLHIQDIMENNGIYDICSNSLLDYGNRYGIFKIGKNGMQYDSKYIDFILDNKSY